MSPRGIVEAGSAAERSSSPLAGPSLSRGGPSSKQVTRGGGVE